MNKSTTLRIKANRLFDGYKFTNDQFIVIEGSKIVDISTSKANSEFEGIVTPAFIDAHSHIGMFREGEPGDEQEGNEHLHQILPLNDPLNSIYFDDRAFKDAIDFGILYSCVIPGSGNLFGGKAKIIRHNALHRGEALVKDYGYKMALGYNPRSTGKWQGERPNTRMGLYGMLERRFDEVLQKKDKQDTVRERKLLELCYKGKAKELSESEVAEEKQLIEREWSVEFSTEEAALLEILNGKKTIKIHVHKEDDVLYLIDLVKRYGLKVTVEHAGDVFHKEIFELIASNNISIIYGPLGSFAYKVELAHSFYQNTRLLMESKANYGLMTDHPVIHVTALRDSLKFFLIFGMSEEEALSLITRKNAEILGIDDTLGTVAVGKTASLLVWDKDPLHLAAMPKVVIAEGQVIRKC